MTAGSDLRHDAAVDRVQLRLRKYLVGEYFPAVLDDSDGSFITGGFKRKYFQDQRLIS